VDTIDSNMTYLFATICFVTGVVLLYNLKVASKVIGYYVWLCNSNPIGLSSKTQIAGKTDCHLETILDF